MSFPPKTQKFSKKKKLFKMSFKSYKTFWTLFLGDLGEDFIKAQVNMGILYFYLFYFWGKEKGYKIEK